MGEADSRQEHPGGMIGPRVPLVAPGSNPALASLEQRIMTERGRISLLYQVLLNSPAIASGWEAMLTAVRNRTAVPADLREMIILRVAVLNRAEYEFDAHVPHAEKAGMPAAKIEALRAEAPDAAMFTPRENLVLALTEAVTRDIVVPDALFARLQAEFGAQDVVELVATAAAYNMVSRFLVALRIGH